MEIFLFEVIEPSEMIRDVEPPRRPEPQEYSNQ